VSSGDACAAKAAPLSWARGQVALTVAWWAAPGIALAVGVRALALGSVSQIGPLGLVSALRPELYIALALLTVSFLSCVFRSRKAPGLLLSAHVVVFVVLLFGAATIIEPLPRIISGWLHVGFADYIARTGRSLPELDARFSWPGFFALAAMATRAAGMKNAMPLLGWTPVVLNLLYGAVVFQLAQATLRDARRAWLAVWLFFPANWVGQDYFGPQALNYLFYLAVLAVLLIWFRQLRFRRPDRRKRGLGRVRRVLLCMARLPALPMLHEPNAHPVGRTSRVGLIGLVVVIFVASTVSHQLTPVAIVISVGALVIAGRCTVRALPLLLSVILIGYISYLTVPYWSGHIHDMFGSFGNVGGTVNHGAVERVRGDEGHRAVVLVRLVLPATVWALAAAGAWRRMRRRHGDLGFLVLAGAPFLLLVAQSYGGEILLRVYSFTLPFMVGLLVAFVAPAWPVRRPVAAAIMAGILSATLTAAFFVARYGNESFEQVRPTDLQAVNWLYAHAPPDSSFVAVTSNVPWRTQGIERYDYRPLGRDLGPTAVPAIEDEMRRNPKGAFLILTKGQSVFAESYLGMPPGWGENIERQVADSGHFQLVYANSEASIYILTAAKGTAGGTHR
jgi:hypothetical protein